MSTDQTMFLMFYDVHLNLTPIFRGCPLFFRVVDLNGYNKEIHHHEIFEKCVKTPFFIFL